MGAGAEFSFRQLKDPHVVSFSPMHHRTGHNVRVHVFTCVLALQVAYLMRHRARQAGMELSVRELLGQLAAIGETVLISRADTDFLVAAGSERTSSVRPVRQTSPPASKAMPSLVIGPCSRENPCANRMGPLFSPRRSSGASRDLEVTRAGVRGAVAVGGDDFNDAGLARFRSRRSGSRATGRPCGVRLLRARCRGRWPAISFWRNQVAQGLV